MKIAVLLAVASVLLTHQSNSNSAQTQPVPIRWLPLVTHTNVVLTREHSVRTWTTSHGLPMNNIQALLQTDDGYLWIGTQGGLARFDGDRFVIFNSASTPAFKKDSCLSLAEGVDGALWIGTVDGLICFRSNRFEHIPLPDSHSDGQRVNGFCVTRSGTVWAASGQGPGFIKGGKFIADPNFQEFKNPRGNAPSRFVSAIQEDQNGNLFLSDLAGLQCRSVGRETWQRISPKVAVEMIRAHDGTIWAVDPHFFQIKHDGLVHQNALRGVFPEGIRAAAAGKPGLMWVASGTEIFRFDGVFKRVRTTQPLPGKVNVLLEDREGNLWAGTTAGLVCLTRQPFSSITTADGLVHDDVWSVSEGADGSLWFGTGGGVSRYHQGMIENYVPESSVLVAAHPAHSVLALKNGVWATPYGVLCRIHPFPPEFPRGEEGSGVAGRPYFEDMDGSVWVQEFGGPLKSWKDGTFKTAFYPPDGVFSILRDRRGRLWIGTRGAGLVMIEGSKTNRLGTPNGLTSDFCGPVLADGDGTVWIVSDKGLNRWEDGRITRYTVENGLNEGFVLNVLEDNFGWFWLNGHRGIYRVRKEQLNDFADGRVSRVAVVAYNEADGLPSAEGNGGWLPNSCKSSDGKLWFPTTKGVAVVDPSDVQNEVSAPRPLITDVIVGDETLFGDAMGLPDLKSAIQLAPGRGKVIRINYTAPAFAANSRADFEYQLENQDTNWISAKSDRFALYTNLRPGSYRFRVRSVTTEGVASEPAMFAFNLAPHFYETWPFYLACGFGLIAMAGAVHARRLFVQRRILALEQQNALEKERARIAADIHDALGGDFSRISILSERLRQAQGSDPAALTAIAETVRGMGASMSELIWATNSRNDTLDNLISYLREHAAKMCDAAGIKLVAEIPLLPPKPISGFQRHNIYLIFREGLNNIVKHAGASEVRIQASLTDDLLEMELADNGRGFLHVGHNGRGNGQSNLRKRAEEIQADIEITSREGIGTSVLLRVPLLPQLPAQDRATAPKTSARPRSAN